MTIEAGGRGYFENYAPLSEFTSADIFATAGARVAVSARFATGDENGRAPYEFTLMFETATGSWDVAGSNIPVTAGWELGAFADHVAALPESTHLLMWLMSDWALPRSFRFMAGFARRTVRLVAADGRTTPARFRWTPRAGLQSVLWHESVKIRDADPDYHRRDLAEAIETGQHPEWELGVQLIDPARAERAGVDVLDPTKILPEEDFPVRPVGRVILDRIAAGRPESEPPRPDRTVPGIAFADDVPVRVFGDCYLQPRRFLLSQTEVEKRHLTDAFVHELSRCDRFEVRAAAVAGLRNVAEGLARAVAAGVGITELPAPLAPAPEPAEEPAASAALSMLANGPDTFAGRSIGVLVTDGVDAAVLDELRSAAAAERATVDIIALGAGGVVADDGTQIEAKHKLNAAPSVLYDAVAVLAADRAAVDLADNAAAREFVVDAYTHGKFIGHDSAEALFDAAGLGDRMDNGFIPLGVVPATDYLQRCRQLRYWGRHWL